MFRLQTIIYIFIIEFVTTPFLFTSELFGENQECSPFAIRFSLETMEHNFCVALS